MRHFILSLFAFFLLPIASARLYLQSSQQQKNPGIHAKMRHFHFRLPERLPAAPHSGMPFFPLFENIPVFTPKCAIASFFTFLLPSPFTPHPSLRSAFLPFYFCLPKDGPPLHASQFTGFMHASTISLTDVVLSRSIASAASR